MLQVMPDAREAVRDEQAVQRVVRSVLAAAGVDQPVRTAAHPAVVAAAFRAQAGHGRTALAGTVVDAALPLGAAAPAAHLTHSAARALAALPAGADASGGSRVVAWGAAQRAVLTESCGWLESAWPQMHAELRACVVQVALLEGGAIDGFTDFASHGAVFVNRSRLGAGSLGLPGALRLAEALVHEGTHTRCNAAALSTPFLVVRAGDASGSELVQTPLRADPRPLAGLFQQAVVLARCAALHQRLLDVEAPATSALAARRDKLADGAWQAIGTLHERSALLSAHGLAVLAQCGELLRAHDVLPSGLLPTGFLPTAG